MVAVVEMQMMMVMVREGDCIAAEDAKILMLVAERWMAMVVAERQTIMAVVGEDDCIMSEDVKRN